MALTGAGRGRLDPIEVEAPTPGPNDVRVRVLACGVCRTDLHVVFAPVGALVPEALSPVVPGGVVVCAGIHVSDIPAMPYRLLWEERSIPSVANLTRRDAREFLALAARVPLRTHVRTYALADANKALDDVRGGRLSGAAVLVLERCRACPRRTR
jgi:D-arabinose 1-dehydrogenase-like Zn-dependent alcohol dehydrogenase